MWGGGETIPNATLVGYREENEEEKRFIYYWLLVRSYVPSVKLSAFWGTPENRELEPLHEYLQTLSKTYLTVHQLTKQLTNLTVLTYAGNP